MAGFSVIITYIAMHVAVYASKISAGSFRIVLVCSAAHASCHGISQMINASI